MQQRPFYLTSLLDYYLEMSHCEWTYALLDSDFPYHLFSFQFILEMTALGWRKDYKLEGLVVEMAPKGGFGCGSQI